MLTCARFSWLSLPPCQDWLLLFFLKCIGSAWKGPFSVPFLYPIPVVVIVSSTGVKEINMPTKNILIGTIYTPPKDTYKQFEDKLSAILQTIYQENKKCYLMGDFNIDLLKIDLNDNLNSFINLMFSSSFYPTISKPTRITKSTATLIDNIFSNTLEEKCKTGLLLTDLSDHLPVFQLNLSEATYSTRKITQVNKKLRTVNDKSIDDLC